ncbi:MAG: gamma-glutamylcyclotransferase family protein [Alphaproteobacteria bacterium]
MPLYFAFDDLMDPSAMESLAPQARALGQGRLPRHRLIVLGGARVTLKRDPQQQVEGTLYDVPISAMAVLDRRFVGAAKIVQPIIGKEGPRRAVLHLLPESSSSASASDRAKLASAARAALLSSSYIEEIETGAISRRKPGTPLFGAPSSTLKR